MGVIPRPARSPGGPGVSPAALGIRAVIVLGAGSVVLATAQPNPVPLVALAVGVLLAVLRPDTVGAWLALPAAAWVFAAGTPHDVAAVPALVAVVGGYLVHTGTAAAATCPWSASWSPAVARRWALRCLPALGLGAALVAVDAGLGAAPDTRWLAVAVAGLTLAAATVLVRLLRGTRLGA